MKRFNNKFLEHSILIHYHFISDNGSANPLQHKHVRFLLNKTEQNASNSLRIISKSKLPQTLLKNVIHILGESLTLIVN